MTDPPGPTRPVAPDDEFFWSAAADGRLVIRRCSDWGPLRPPPAPMCGTCGSLAWDTAEASGRGRIVSWISSLHPNRPDDAARIVILGELEEGTRLVSNRVNPPPPGPYDDPGGTVKFRAARARARRSSG